MRIKLIILTALLVFSQFLSGCTDEQSVSLLPSKVNYKNQLDLNSPEGLAKASSDISKSMVDGSLDIEEGCSLLIDYSCENSRKALEEQKNQFISSIKQLKDYFSGQSNPIAGYEFSETFYESDSKAQIYRIQIHKNGKRYYFCQDFIIEDGKWKILGDNMADPFTLKSKILFWYF